MPNTVKLDVTDGRLNELMTAIMSVGRDLELATLLDRIVEAAVSLVDCRYGALGVLADTDGTDQLVAFHTVGMTEHERQQVGDLPRGYGILGLLTQDPRPLRLGDLSSHPASVGFPPHHPPMTSFLGVPVTTDGQVYGNLYLTEKNHGESFNDADEALLVMLAAAAGIAIGNARLYQEARRTAQWQRASAEITRQLLAGTEPGEVLELVAEHARQIAQADVAAIGFEDHAGNFVVEVASGTGSKALLATPLPLPDPCLSVPLTGTGRQAGVLSVANRKGGSNFGRETVGQLLSFAAQAELAMELAQARLGSERVLVFEDRDRIARDLHDSVIQRLFAAGMQLEGTARTIADGATQDRIRQVSDDLDATISDIRSTIYSLQTVERDQPRGLHDRIIGLAEQLSSILGSMPIVDIRGPLDDAVPDAVGDDLIVVVREALSNIARHAHASNVEVTVDVTDFELTLSIRDDGRGFAAGDVDLRRSGLANLANRAVGHGGTFLVRSDEGSPLVRGDDQSLDTDWATELTWSVPIVGA